MYKVLAVVVLCCLASQAAANPDKCSAAAILQQCLPDFQQYVHRAGSVNSLTALTVATNSTGFLSRCQRFIEVGACVRQAFQTNGCTVPTDGANPNVIRFRTASEAVRIICIDKAAEFQAARECLSAPGVRQAIQACANAGGSGHSLRRKRHTCIDYSNEVACAGAAVRSACPDIAVHFHAFAGRLLKMTPHTAGCVAPAVLAN